MKNAGSRTWRSTLTILIRSLEDALASAERRILAANEWSISPTLQRVVPDLPENVHYRRWRALDPTIWIQHTVSRPARPLLDILPARHIVPFSHSLQLDPRRSSMKRLAVVLMLLVPFGALADAPETATVSGTIVDPGGSALPGVTSGPGRSSRDLPRRRRRPAGSRPDAAGRH